MKAAVWHGVKDIRVEEVEFGHFRIYRTLSFPSCSIHGGTRDSIYLIKSYYFLLGKEV